MCLEIYVVFVLDVFVSSFLFFFRSSFNSSCFASSGVIACVLWTLIKQAVLFAFFITFYIPVELFDELDLKYPPAEAPPRRRRRGRRGRRQTQR